MPELEEMLMFPKRLDEAGIGYMTTGGIACILYGEPRMTHDIDIVIELNSADIAKLIAAFPSSEFYCPPAEAIGVEIGRETRGHFNIICMTAAAKADVYPLGRDRLARWAFPLRRQLEFGGAKLWVAPPEYVIVRKLQYYQEGGSEKHVLDIGNMLRISGDQIDQQLLVAKIEENGLLAVWRSWSAES